ncbi:hypothetical protein R1sor_007487 [Riccia sorocarpa]|uniref:Nuclease HARBI1 n=1 Tax=Riccia sorocarpa TaxID=122646 RepID=A0ABD3HUS0_9MARC
MCQQLATVIATTVTGVTVLLQQLLLSSLDNIQDLLRLDFTMSRLLTAWVDIEIASGNYMEDSDRWWVKQWSLIWFDYYLMHSYENSRSISCLRMPQRIFKLIVPPSVCRADTRYRKAVPPEVRIAATIFRLATGSSYFNTAERFGVGFSTVQEFMPEVVRAIIRILGPVYLKWPSSTELQGVAKNIKDI